METLIIAIAASCLILYLFSVISEKREKRENERLNRSLSRPVTHKRKRRAVVDKVVSENDKTLDVVKHDTATVLQYIGWVEDLDIKEKKIGDVVTCGGKKYFFDGKGWQIL